MADMASPSEEVVNGRDGEVQQLSAEERLFEQHEAADAAVEEQNHQRSSERPMPNASMSNQRRRLDSKPQGTSKNSAPSNVSGSPAAPTLLQITRNNNKALPVERKRIKAASEATEGAHVLDRKYLVQERGGHSHGGALNWQRSPYGNGKQGAYGKLLRETARALALRPPSAHQSVDRVSRPNSSQKKDCSQPRAASPASVSPFFPPPITDIHSLAVSERECEVRGPVCQGIAMLGDDTQSGGGGEVVTIGGGSVNGAGQGCSSTSATRRVVHQSGAINRDKDNVLGLPPFHVCEKQRESLGRGRVLAFNDLLWRREHESRWLLPQEERGAPFPSSLPQIVMETPELPQVLEVALADRFLAVLMTCPHSEVERIVAALAPNDVDGVLQYLRQTYSSKRHSTRPSVSDRARLSQDGHRAEWLSTHRRHVQGTMRSIASSSRAQGERNGSAPHISREVRHFLRRFTREACMRFLDGVCAACAVRRDRARAEQPQEVQARCVPLPAEVLDPLFGQVVVRLLFQILGWTEKESARLLPAVVQQVKHYLPSFPPTVTQHA